MTAVPRLAMFDLDGTLVGFHHQYLYDETHRILNILGRAQVEESILESGFAAFDYFRFIAESERAEFIEAFWANFDWSGFPSPIPFPGVCQELEKFRDAGVHLAIVTSRFIPEETLREELAGSGLLEIINCIWTRPDRKINWTDKQVMIQAACEDFAVDPAQALMVGDSPSDIESANDVGVGLSAAVLSGGIREDVLAAAEPTFVLADVGELADKVLC